MKESEIKAVPLTLGADLCGLAPVERFSSAPKGFHPNDISPYCRSVLVFAKKQPAGSLFASSRIPYNFINQAITVEVDALTLTLSRSLDNLGLANVSIPSDDPLEYWEAERSYARGILSLRHAAYLAGLGVLGKNTLLINDKLGNMIQLGALLLDEPLEGDPIVTYEPCENSCELCIQSCPQSALDGITVNQQACRVLSNHKNAGGAVIKKCWECRRICGDHNHVNNVA